MFDAELWSAISVDSAVRRAPGRDSGLHGAGTRFGGAAPSSTLRTRRSTTSAFARRFSMAVDRPGILAALDDQALSAAAAA